MLLYSVLNYNSNQESKLLGYFKDRMISYFTDKNIPIELRKLFNLN